MLQTKTKVLYSFLYGEVRFWSVISVENWTRQCDRLIELMEGNDLAQMNTSDLETYSKLINELDSTIVSFKRTIVK